MDDASQAGIDFALSPINLAEIVYLVEKHRLAVSAHEGLKAALADPDCVIDEALFTADVTEAMRYIPRADMPEMADRIVAATAFYLRVPVISRDGRIRSSNIQTIW